MRGIALWHTYIVQLWTVTNVQTGMRHIEEKKKSVMEHVELQEAIYGTHSYQLTLSTVCSAVHWTYLSDTLFL